MLKKIFRSLLGLIRRNRAEPLPLTAENPTKSPFLPQNAVPSTNVSDTSDASSSHASSNVSDAAADRAAARKTKFETLKQVLNVLRAYVLTFGQPAEVDLRAVVGAIVANLPTVAIANDQLERFIDEVMIAFSSLGMEASLVEVTAQILAEQVAVWLKEQENTVNNVLSAYVQQFAPDYATWDLPQIVSLTQTIVATLNDGSLSRSGGRSLVNKVAQAFDLQKALSRWVAPEWIALAQRVASYVENGSIQSELRSIAWSYIQQFQAILSPQSIDQIIRTGPINLSPAEVLSGDLSDFSQMLYYKFQLLEADPIVTKSHQAIAANVHKAVSDFQARRKDLAGVDLDFTASTATGELEVSSPFFVQTKPAKS
ncbi:MAG: hypothetical protein DCF15_10830 [Phormidesmis priestleyi]|uniref:Uncharacterized protein n=1 Tax=Phormidesmis priestleyi TaxID=268141 RepID=A0A2W4ZAK9_9CYAN|nr:MAG: hypothetical protein DCF15_10830 [Phormidesmis priestleyi]